MPATKAKAAKPATPEVNPDDWTEVVKKRFRPDDVVEVPYKDSNNIKYRHLGAPAKNRLFINDYRKHEQKNRITNLGDGWIEIHKSIRPDPTGSPEWVVEDSIVFKFNGDPDNYARMDTKLLARLLSKLGYSYDGEIEALTDAYSTEPAPKANGYSNTAPAPAPEPAAGPELDVEAERERILEKIKKYDDIDALRKWYATLAKIWREDLEIEAAAQERAEELKENESDNE